MVKPASDPVRRAVFVLVPFGLTLALWIASAQESRRVDDAALRNAGKAGGD